MSLIKKPTTEKLSLSLQPRRLAKSLEDLNSLLALSAEVLCCW